MASFHHFPNLPPELRLEVWRAYFAVCHGTQIHIFFSSSEGPRYVNQDAATGVQGHDTLAAARVCADSWVVFRESFYVGDMRSLQPSRRTAVAAAAAAAEDDEEQQQQQRRRYAREFAVAAEDMMYIVDSRVSPILAALSSTSWFHRARRVAMQVFNFHTPAPNPQRLPDPRPYPHNLDYWGRNWVLWNQLLTALPPDVRRMMKNPALKQLLFVVVPSLQVQRTRPLKPNTYGFVFIDPESFVLGSPDETQAVWGHARLTAARIGRIDLGLEMYRKIGYVVDAVPARAQFSCLDKTYVTNY
ncbi:hypothetical protein F5Y12DRAFT_390803 [Xylaria sp. FL1777]|nr:hypothetical protein F5Y12DRAFT_390803 [Xylaria sp. FL1777]